MVTWQTAVVIVAAVVAGALLPVLVQLSLTLRSSRTALEETSVRLGRALEAVTSTAGRLDRIAAGLEQTVDQVRESVRIASAVGAAVAPSVGAAVRAWRAGAPEERERPGHADAWSPDVPGPAARGGGDPAAPGHGNGTAPAR